MSRELDLLAREFSKTSVTVLRTQINLFHSNIQTTTSPFLKKIEQECKKEKQPTVTLVAIIE